MNQENCYTVYCHETPSGKRYVGITRVGFQKRWLNGRGYVYNEHFWSAIQKYGWNNIQHYVLFENLTKEQAQKKEIELIAIWNTTNRNYGYNNDYGGGGCNRFTPETKAKMSNGHKGKPLSEKTKEKMSQVRKGVPKSDETRKRISESLTGLKYSHDRVMKTAIKKSNKVYQYDLNLNFVSEYYSLREAERQVRVSRHGISQCCKHEIDSYGGYIWSYTPLHDSLKKQNPE